MTATVTFAVLFRDRTWAKQDIRLPGSHGDRTSDIQTARRACETLNQGVGKGLYMVGPVLNYQPDDQKPGATSHDQKEGLPA